MIIQKDIRLLVASRRYPKIDLSLRAPIELENLLPYNLQYRIYDKDTDQNWRSYLRKGGVMPVHSVELGHLVLLNVEIQETRPFSCLCLHPLCTLTYEQSSSRATSASSTQTATPTSTSRND